MVSELTAEQLALACADPFVRHHLLPAGVRRAWRHGQAYAVDHLRVRREGPGPTTSLTCLGPTEDLAALLAALPRLAPTPGRLTVEIEAAHAVPEKWRQRSPEAWDWMLTTERPAQARTTGEVTIGEVADAAAIGAVLDVANPGSLARPEDARIEAWLGATHGRGPLLGVGALVRMGDHTGHLRGIAVLPSARGHGVGRALTAALTSRGFDHGSGVVTLGVYSDNATAMRIYAELGYRRVHRFVSGPVTDPAG